MIKKSHLNETQRAIDIGNYAYDLFEHVEAVLEGMEALAQTDNMNDRIKLTRLEKSIKTALYLTRGNAWLVDGKTEELKEELNEDEL